MIVILKVEDYKQAVKKTVFAAARSDSRFSLNGVLIECKGKNITFVASDTHRLSIFKIKVKVKLPEVSVIVSATEFKKSLKGMKKNDSVVLEISDKGDMASVTVNGKVNSLPLIDGRFPRYRDVLPKENTYSTVAEGIDIKTALAITEHLDGLKEDTPNIRVVVNRLVKFFVGDAGIEAGCKKTGEDIHILFNSRYLVDAFRSLDEKEVTIRFKENTPCMMSEGNYTHIIMPFKSH